MGHVHVGALGAATAPSRASTWPCAGPATASSSDSDSNGPDRAVDGNPRTRWSSKFEDNQWIQVDLGAPVSFDQVTIVWEQAYARDFVIQVSDDGSGGPT